MFKAPAFWAAGSASVWPLLLGPLATLYGLGNRLNRAFATAPENPIPVISVGNLVAGGAGKTPVALAIRRPTGRPTRGTSRSCWPKWRPLGSAATVHRR